VATDKRARQRANRQLRYQEQAKVERRRSFTRRFVIGAAAVLLAIGAVIGIALLGGAGDEEDDAATSTTGAVASTPQTTTDAAAGFTYGTGQCPPAEVSEPTREFDDAPQECIDPARSYSARIVTSEGDIVVDLDVEGVPGTVNNFVTLARYGYYDDTQVFRASAGIDIIQGGGNDNLASPGYEIPDEGGRFAYQPGQIVMARTAAPDSAGGQWFITTGDDASNLDQQGTYVTFGTLTEGLEVAQAIQELGQEDESLTREVTVETVEITET